MTSCAEDSEGALFVIADIFQWKEQGTRRNQKFEATGEVTYWRAEEVIVPCVWYRESDDLIIVF